jgi:positive regulator of sigma E activity
LVLIDVPENTYSRALIVMFGGLMIGALAGMGLGYLSSLLFSADPAISAPAGFFLGIGGAVIWLAAYFRRHNQKTLYPKIIDIIKKGDRHE